MARTVQEIMNRELLAVRPDLPISDVRDLLRSFGVGAAPVLDEARRPLGIVSVRDLLEGGGAACDHMTRPVIGVDASTPVEEAARRLARSDMHHLIVVDDNGVAVGMLSSLDLLRGVLGMPAHHPDTFPHWDDSTRVSWTDDWAFEEENFAHAPDAPGVLALVRASAGEQDEIVWVEACANTRERLVELNDDSTLHPPSLTRVLAFRGLRFRAASVREEPMSTRIVKLLRDRLDHLPPPGAT
jgi:hypothetical protein